MYVIFNDENLCRIACSTMKYNAVKKIADNHNGMIIVNTETGEEAYFYSLTMKEINDIAIFGYKDGSKNTKDGFTMQINVINKAYEFMMWYIKYYKELMSGVVGYVDIIDEIPETWFPPFEP